MAQFREESLIVLGQIFENEEFRIFFALTQLFRYYGKTADSMPIVTEDFWKKPNQDDVMIEFDSAPENLTVKFVNNEIEEKKQNKKRKKEEEKRD